MHKTGQIIPTARRADLLIEEAEGETLIYDLKSNKAHCLNRTAAIVWKYCDGKRTASQVARKVEAELGELISDDVVWLAVSQLEKRKLLEETAERAYTDARISRREMARRLGLATAVALPFIATIKAPAAIQAASCTGPEERCGGTNPPCCVGTICCSNGFCLEECPAP